MDPVQSSWSDLNRSSCDALFVCINCQDQREKKDQAIVVNDLIRLCNRLL